MDFSDEHETFNDSDEEHYEASTEQRRKPQEPTYTVLSESDIKKLQQEDISSLANTLSIPETEACRILCHYSWSLSKALEDWFSDEAKVRDAIFGQPQTATNHSNGRRMVCGICFESCSLRKMTTAGCGHYFCLDCWKGYVSTAINGGPGCLTLRCPDPACKAGVSRDIVHSLVEMDDKLRYDQYLLRSYVEENRKLKWCPGADCNFAVQFDGVFGEYDVGCCCGLAFCWNCVEEAHRPVPCDTVRKWILKNSSESENANWILANSKPCPKCKRPIEKIYGCNHMTCGPPCRFEFCWLCLQDYRGHSCNRYSDVGSREDKRRSRAKSRSERYMHYWERWAANQKSRKIAIEDLRAMKGEKLDNLREKLDVPVSQLSFITEAWEKIVECRRILAWTYPYGYYLDEKEATKKELFEFLQGEAESNLERLHRCAEVDIDVLFEAEQSLSTGTTTALQLIGGFRTKLAGLTRITGNYFENLVQALENGLQEVEGEEFRATKRLKETAPAGGIVTYAGYEDVGGYWPCVVCTTPNPVRGTNICQACDAPRYGGVSKD